MQLTVLPVLYYLLKITTREYCTDCTIEYNIIYIYEYHTVLYTFASLTPVTVMRGHQMPHLLLSDTSDVINARIPLIEGVLCVRGISLESPAAVPVRINQ
jgi:hypothetical protein